MPTTVRELYTFTQSDGESGNIDKHHDPNYLPSHKVFHGAKPYNKKPLGTAGSWQHTDSNPLAGDYDRTLANYSYCTSNNSSNGVSSFTYTDNINRKLYLVVAGTGGKGASGRKMKTLNASDLPNLLTLFIGPKVSLATMFSPAYLAYTLSVMILIQVFNEFVYDPKIIDLYFGGGGGGAGQARQYLIEYRANEHLRIDVDHNNNYRADYEANLLPYYMYHPHNPPSEFTDADNNMTYTKVSIYINNALINPNNNNGPILFGKTILLNGYDSGTGELMAFAGIGGGGGEGGVNNFTNKGENGSYPGGGGSGGGISSKKNMMATTVTDGGHARGTFLTFYDFYPKDRKEVIHGKKSRVYTNLPYTRECLYGGRGGKGGSSRFKNAVGIVKILAPSGDFNGRDAANGISLVYYNIYHDVNGVI